MKENTMKIKQKLAAIAVAALAFTGVGLTVAAPAQAASGTTWVDKGCYNGDWAVLVVTSYVGTTEAYSYNLLSGSYTNGVAIPSSQTRHLSSIVSAARFKIVGSQYSYYTYCA